MVSRMGRGTAAEQEIDVVVDLTQPTVKAEPVSHRRENKLWSRITYGVSAAVLAAVVVLAGNSTTNGDAKFEPGEYPVQR